MRKVVALVMAFLLLFPMVAYAEEATITPETSVTPDAIETQEATSTPDNEVKVIPIFSYQVVIEIGEEGVSVSLVKVEEGVEEEIASYSFEGAMGKVISVVARAVPAGPEHGKVVSGYVKEITREKKREKEEERVEKKERKREEKEACRENKEKNKDLQEAGKKGKGKKNRDKEEKGRKGNHGKKGNVEDSEGFLLFED